MERGTRKKGKKNEWLGRNPRVRGQASVPGLLVNEILLFLSSAEYSLNGELEEAYTPTPPSREIDGPRGQVDHQVGDKVEKAPTLAL